MNWLTFLIFVTLGIYSIERKQTYTKPKHVKSKYKSEVELSSQQLALLDILNKTKNHIFITGKAGTGKSVLLSHFKNNTSKKLVVVAPTGIAALNIQGQTIHSLFNIRPDSTAKQPLSAKGKETKLLESIDTLVIDEISMVGADLVDLIDQKLRLIRKSQLPFGGVKLIMFGDLYQLPPIISDRVLSKYLNTKYKSIYFFDAHVWHKTKMDTYELTKIFRQKDDKYKKVLNSIRVGQANERILKSLNARIKKKIPTDGAMTLAVANKDVDLINQSKLNQIKSNEYIFKATKSGNFKKSECLAEDELKLKVGAQVMMIRNDKNKRWVNGTIGQIKTLSSNSIKVKINSQIYEVEKATWSKIKYSFNLDKNMVEKTEVGSITQYPLKLAWAVTIHKSQGQTFDKCVVDLKRGAFAKGQTYVALSRCKSLAGLYLTSPILPSDIEVAKEVAKFMSLIKPIHVA